MRINAKTIVVVLLVGLAIPLFMVQSRRDRTTIEEKDSDLKVDRKTAGAPKSFAKRKEQAEGQERQPEKDNQKPGKGSTPGALSKQAGSVEFHGTQKKHSLESTVIADKLKAPLLDSKVIAGEPERKDAVGQMEGANMTKGSDAPLHQSSNEPKSPGPKTVMIHKDQGKDAEATVSPSIATELNQKTSAIQLHSAASGKMMTSKVAEKLEAKSATSMCNVVVFWPRNYCSHALFKVDCQKSSLGSIKARMSSFDKTSLGEVYKYVKKEDCVAATQSEYPKDATEQDPAGEDAAGMLQMIQSQYKFIEAKHNAIPDSWYDRPLDDLLKCKECEAKSTTIQNAAARKREGKSPAFVVSLAPGDDVAKKVPSSSLEAVVAEAKAKTDDSASEASASNRTTQR